MEIGEDGFDEVSTEKEEEDFVDEVNNEEKDMEMLEKKNVEKNFARQESGGKRWLESKLETIFERLGYVVVQRPWRAIVVTCLVFGAVASGIIFLETEERYDELYNPQRGASAREEKFLRQRFGEVSRVQIAILEAKSNILEKRALEEALSLDAKITSARWEDVCQRAWLPDGPCQHSSMLNLWETNADLLAADDDIYNTISADPLWDPVLRRPASLEIWAAKVVTNASRVNAAKALQLTYAVDDSLGDPRSVTLRFERNDFLDACDDFKSDLIDVYCSASSSYADLNQRETERNTFFLILAVLLMVGYVTFYFYRCDPVESRALLGLTAITTVGLALCFALGICGFLNIPFTFLSFLSIFVLLGVGIDDMIIIVDAVDRRAKLYPEAHPDKECIVFALREVGASILLSTMTDFFALLIGSFIDLPAITYFCITAALAVLAVFLIQITFFIACLALDLRRRRANRFEMLPCIKRIPPLGKRESAAKINTEDRPLSRRSLQRVEVANTVAYHLASKPQTVVFIFAVLAAGFATTAATRLKTGSKWSLFLPRGSYLLDFYDARDRTFGDLEEVTFVSGRVRVENPKHLAAVADLSARVAGLTRVSPPVWGWYEAWNHSTNFSATIDNLQAFIATPAGRPYAEDLRFEGDRLLATRIRVLAAFPKDADRQIRLTYRLRRAARKAKANNVKFKVTAIRFSWLERYEAIYINTITSLGGAIFAVILLCSCLLSPLATFLVALNVMLVNVSILGGMALCGFKLNVVSLINLIMSIGFSVDFGAHIAYACSHHFRSNGGLAANAVEAALTEIGPSVLNGGTSTALAVFVLAFSAYFGYFQLATMFIMMVISGLCHGLLFIPAAFCLVHTLPYSRPSSCCVATKDEAFA